MTQSLRKALLGTWHLKEWTTSWSDERDNSQPYGPNAVGILVYTEDGYMSANISRAERPPLSRGSPRQASAGEKISAFESNFSYAGPYRIEGETVIHDVEHALNPNMVGTRQSRTIAFKGGNLILAATETFADSSVARYHRLTWSRHPRSNGS